LEAWAHINGARPRIAVWSSGVPDPTEGASTVIFWHYLNGLKARGAEVLHVVLVQSGNGSEEDVERYRRTLGDQHFRVVTAHAEAFWDADALSVRPRPGASTEAVEAVRHFSPDASLCLDIGPLMIAQQVTGIPTLAWLGDLGWQTTWYHAKYAAAERRRSAVRLPMAALRARAWRNAYRRTLAHVDDVVVASQSSVSDLSRLGIRSTYLPYPWPPFDGGTPARTSSSVPTFLFLGTMQALGSRSAFHFLLRRVYPLLISQWGPGGFRILVAGRGRVPPWALDGMRRRAEFEHLGFVDDLGPLLASVHAVIAPIEVPVGNRTRILTAMSAGTLVVAHRNAALGNPDLVDSRTCYLAATAEEFAERMRRAVDDSDGSARIAAAGQQSYLRSFEPGLAANKLLDRLKELTASFG
jgi:glycosyltransferase involved in cell wall biosynthesis